VPDKSFLLVLVAIKLDFDLRVGRKEIHPRKQLGEAHRFLIHSITPGNFVFTGRSKNYRGGKIAPGRG